MVHRMTVLDYRDAHLKLIGTTVIDSAVVLLDYRPD